MSIYEQKMREHQSEYYRAIGGLVYHILTLVWAGWVTWRLLR